MVLGYFLLGLPRDRIILDPKGVFLSCFSFLCVQKAVVVKYYLPQPHFINFTLEFINGITQIFLFVFLSFL